MAAGEDQPQPIINALRLTHLPRPARARRLGLGLANELFGLLDQSPRPPDPIDRRVLRRRGDPGRGITRHTSRGPRLERPRERVLNRFLGEVEVAEDTAPG